MKKQSKSPFFSFCLTWLCACFLALTQAQADSLWAKETAVSLFSDHKAKQVGDIITVVVLESNSASRNSSAKTEKKSDISASISNFINANLDAKLKDPKLGTTSQSNFEGKGAVSNSGSFNSRFAVRVVDVLPNNNLIIEGVRRSTFSGESQTIILKGTVRPQDVTPLNTVYSYHLADVSIALKDEGAVSDSRKKGWFSKLWGKIAPFFFMYIFLSSLVWKFRSILKVLGMSRNSVRSGSLDLGARDSALFGSLSFLSRMPVVTSVFKLMALRLCLPMGLSMVQVINAQPLPQAPQASPVGRVNVSQMNLNVQVRDLCFVLGARDNQLVGYGIVSGLAGDGDKDPDYTLQAVSNMLERFGLTLPPSALTSKNIAAVMLTADIPPFVRSGSRIDVHVSAMGDARSLNGAILARTPLLGPNGKIYAVAQGPVAVGGFIGGIPGPGGASVQKNHPTSGQIIRGALVEEEIPVSFVREKKVELIMRQPDFVNAQSVAQAVNREVGALPLIHKLTEPALAINASTIQVKIPDDYAEDPVRYLAYIEQLMVSINTPARVVLNERTGTIVATSRVAVSSCAVAHGNIIVNIAQGYDITQPQVPLAGGAPIIAPSADIVINEGEGMLTPFRGMPTVQDVASSLNALGVTPRDMMAIFQAMKQAGALQAELILR